MLSLYMYMHSRLRVIQRSPKIGINSIDWAKLSRFHLNAVSETLSLK
jgi:hypothetical protein